MNRTKSIKNLVYGLVSFAVTTLLGIVIPRLVLVSYGSETNGLLNSVRQIFAYFALLEAGVGAAALQALYGPVGRGEREEVCAILAAAQRFFRRTGVLYALGVGLLALVYPLLVRTQLPGYLVVGVILFQGLSSVVKYFTTASVQLLLRVDGKNYVLGNISMVFTVLSNVARIWLMSRGFGVLWVQGAFCLVDLCQAALVAGYARRHYPWLTFRAKPNEQAVAQRGDVLVHQLSALVFNNTDTILITGFCGLKLVSVYGMYAMLYGMVASMVTLVSSSLNFALGQLFHRDRERYRQVQGVYETYYLALSFALFYVAFLFIRPFLALYTAGAEDISYQDHWLPGLFLLMQLLKYGRNPSNNSIDYAGHYRQTKWRSVLESAINLVVSLVCIPALGIYGAVLGTIAALFYRTNDIIVYAHRVVLGDSPWLTYRRWLRNGVVLAVLLWAGRLLPRQYSGYVPLIATAALTTVVVLAAFAGVNTLLEPEARRAAWAYFREWKGRPKRKNG